MSTQLRALGAVALAMLAMPAARAEQDEAAQPVSVAVGVKTGLIPPVLAVPELAIGFPHLWAGLFGIATGGGMGSGGARSTVGGELTGELFAENRDTPYLSTAFFHYRAAPDASGFYEKSDLLAVTGGYEWKWPHLDLQLGGGLLFLVRQDKAACTGWGCIDMQSPVMPAVDLSLRYRF